MRIVFMGTPEFAVPSLTAMLAHGDEVVAVVTQPDRPRGRGRKVTPSPVKAVAEKAGLDVLQPTRIRTEEFLEQIRAYRPDLIVVTAYGRILPKALIELPDPRHHQRPCLAVAEVSRRRSDPMGSYQL